MKLLTSSLLFVATTAFVVPIHHHHSSELASSRKMFEKNADMNRAKDCATEFGKCCIHEVKELRDSIHEDRIQTMFLSNVAGGAAHVEDKLLEQRLLEDDLSLQLSLLDKELPPLFLMEEEMATTMSTTDEALPPMPRMNDGIYESAAICAVLGLIVFAPNLLN